jgi:hypothetical protein
MSTVCSLCIALTLDASLTQLLWQGIFWMTKDELLSLLPDHLSLGVGYVYLRDALGQGGRCTATNNIV